jgi:hypothetical protein
VRTLIDQNITDKLGALDGRNPKLPVGPIAGDQKGIIAELVRQVIESDEQELVAAIRVGAQARVNQLKAQLSNKVTKSVTSHGFSRDFLCKLFAVNCFELEDPGTVFDLIKVV